MRFANKDPRVSLPIVCGEYMRATGTFFVQDGTKYLVTARHNVLPTNGSELKTGSGSFNFRTDDYLPVIDLYLRKSTEFDIKHLDIREVDGVRQIPEIDIIAVPIKFDPEEYGYHIWEEDDVSSPHREMKSLDVLGFEGNAFPSQDRVYNTELYRNEIGMPVAIELENELQSCDDLSKYGLTGIGIDEDSPGNDEDYDGLSGSPVVGDGLLGIHGLNSPIPVNCSGKSSNESMGMIYWRASLLPKLLG